MTVVKSSSRVPVCATLDRAGLRAGTCAVRRGARVTPPVTDTSVAPQDNFPLWPWKKRQSRRIRPGLRPSTVINIRQSTTITSPQIPFPDGSGRLLSRENRQRTYGTHVYARVEGRGSPSRDASCHTRVDFARGVQIIVRRARQTGSTGPGSSLFSAPIVTELTWSRSPAREDTNRCRVVSRNREHWAASTRSYHRSESPATRRRVRGTRRKVRISQPRRSWERILGASSRDHLVGSFCNRYDSNMYEYLYLYLV